MKRFFDLMVQHFWFHVGVMCVVMTISAICWLFGATIDFLAVFRVTANICTYGDAIATGIYWYLVNIWAVKR